MILQDGTNRYLYGLDLISATDGAGDQTNFTYDGLGSVTDLTDDNGDEIDDYTYDVFGAIRSESGTSDNYWLFTGEQSDSDEGLYYLRARYYDPATGRFLGLDPLPAGHPYVYGANNPVRYLDRSGLCHVELGWDQLCGVWAHKPKEGSSFKPTTRDFQGEWTVMIGKLGSGKAHENVKFYLWARVTRLQSGTQTYFTVRREGSDSIVVVHGTVFYERGEFSRGLAPCTGPCLTAPGHIGSATVKAGSEAGDPVRIELEFQRNAFSTQPGSFINSDRVWIDLQTGEAGQHICPITNIWDAAYGNLGC